MIYLTQTIETYRVDDEQEAKDLIEEAKHAPNYVLTKYSSEQKEVKEKGNVIEEFYKVSLTKTFTDIKSPDCQTKVTYEVN